MHQKVNEAVKITIPILHPVITMLHDVQDIFQLSTRAAKEQAALRHLPKNTEEACVSLPKCISIRPQSPLSALSIHFYCIKNCRRKAKL